MKRLCPASFAVTAETKSRSVCQDVHRKPQPSSLLLSIRPSSQGSDWRGLYRDNLNQKSTSLSLILKGSRAVPNKVECWFLRKVSAFWASICSCFVGLCTEPLARNVRLWKLLLRFAETVFAISFFHSSRAMIPRVNEHETNSSNVQEEIGHDKPWQANVTEGTVIRVVQKEIAQSLN